MHVEHVSESHELHAHTYLPLQDFPESGCIRDKLSMGNDNVDN